MTNKISIPKIPQNLPIEIRTPLDKLRQAVLELSNRSEQPIDGNTQIKFGSVTETRIQKGLLADVKAVRYYIDPISGTAIKNSTGTLTIKATKVDGSGSTRLSSGNIKMYKPDGTLAGNGYTWTAGAAEINDSIIITLRDSVTKVDWDTITLIDITDGGASIVGSITASNGLAWSRAIDAGAWTPNVTTTDLTATFYSGGSSIATRVVRITRDDNDGTMEASLQSNNGEATTHNVIGSNSTAISIEFIHTASSLSVFETVLSVQGGASGSPGTNASTVSLSATSQTFSYDNATGTPALIGPDDITFTLNRQNITGSTTWTMFDDTGASLTVADYLTPGYSNTSAELTATEFATITNNDFVRIVATADGLSDSITIVKLQTGQDGEAASAGLNVATVYIYQRTATDSAPALPTTGSTPYPAVFTFASGALTALDNGWTHTIPVAGTDPYLWVSIATASSVSATDDITFDQWQTPPQKLAEAGPDGLSGYNTATLTAYQRAAVQPTVMPTDDLTYTFSTGAWTPGNSWSIAIPAYSTDPLWAISATAFSRSDTTTIDENSWSTPAQIAVDGVDGAGGAAGAAGADSRTVNLTAGKMAFLYLTDDTLNDDATTVITATALNADGVPNYEFFLNDIPQQDSTTATWTYTPQASYGDMPDTVEVHITEDGPGGTIYARDQITIVGIKPGVDAPLVVQHNEAHSVPFVGGVDDFTGSGNTLEVYLGATKIAYDSSSPYATPSFRVSGAVPSEVTIGTPIEGATDITYGEITAMTANTGSITYTIVVKNNEGIETTITRVQSLTRSVQGLDGDIGDPGQPGDDAISHYLTNESHSVAADKDGENYSLVGAGGIHKVFDGLTDITSAGAWHSVASAATVDGLTMAINATSGVYSLSGTWTGTDATFTLRFSYNGVSYDRVYSITKSIKGQDGNVGQSGYSSATLTAYRRLATVPTDNPGTLTYTFASASWTPGNNWTKSIPIGTEQLYAVSATAFGQGDDDEVGVDDWSDPAAIGTDGADGLNVATAFIYQRTASDVAPALLPTATATFTFETGVITGLTESWTYTIPPASGGAFLWVSFATASASAATDDIDADEWEAAQRLAQDGTDGQPGTDGDDGNNAIQYYIKPTAGTAIKNSDPAVNLTLEARKLDGASNTLLSTGDIKLYDPIGNVVTLANGYVTGSDGYTGILNADDIDGAKVITLRDATTTYDTITLVDVTDGADSTEPGPDGTHAVYGYIEATNGLAFTRAADGTTWAPDFNNTILTATFVQNGVQVGQHSVTVSRSSSGILSASSGATGFVSASISENLSQALTVSFDYDDGVVGTSKVSETVMTSMAGAAGNYRDIKFRRSSVELTTAPTGDNPADWYEDIPPGSDTLWQIVATKTAAGVLIGVWSVPERIQGLTYRGPYAAGTTYILHDFVTYAERSYICVLGTTGNAPSGTNSGNTWWDLLAGKGDTGAPPTAFNETIPITGTGPVNLRTLADTHTTPYDGVGDATITFTLGSGVIITGSPGNHGINTGAWPDAATIALTLQIDGTVRGGGGGGGNGGSGFGGGNGKPGSDGGDAIYLQEAMTGGITVNSGGLVQGGGGGGGGGGGAAYPSSEPEGYGGGGGGGGFPNGAAGSGGVGPEFAGTAGSAGTVGGGGAKGGGAGTAGDGGNGGGAAANGGSGSNGIGEFKSGTGGTRGDAGYAIRKNGHSATVSGPGTITGTQG